MLLLACGVLAGPVRAQNQPEPDPPQAPASPQTAVAVKIRAGASLAQALESLRAAGLELLYSSQLVQPGMRVARAPQARSLPAILAEILAPHGLVARPMGDARYLIVRAAPGHEAPPAIPPGDAPPLDEVLVHASRYELHRAVGSTLTVLDRERLDAMPGVEQDVIRSLQRLPGSASGGLSATSHVRGSYDDEVLMHFDGVRLYEPFHFKDFLNLFGAIDPELIESVDVYSGGFPAQYGDRAGAILDMSARRARGRESLIGTSVLNHRLISSGSHAAERGEWLVGYRRSNLAAVIRQLDRDVGEPQFEDLLVRYAYQVTPTLSAAAGLLALEDDHELFTEGRSEEATAGYDDDAAWMRLDYTDRRGWSLGLHASHTHLAARRAGSVDRPGVSVGSLEEGRVATLDNVRLSWALPASQRLHWRGGIDLTRGKASYDYRADAVFEEPLAQTFGRPSTLTQRVNMRVAGDAAAPWAAARGEMGAATVELGLRYDQRDWVDGDGQWSPRVSARYELPTGTVLRASAGRFLQFQTLNELEVEEPAPQFAAPESSRQLIFGLEQPLPARMRLRLELFDRHMRGVRPRFENLLNPLVLLPEIEVDRVRVAPQSSRSRGAELTLQSEPRDDLSWWATYTWSRSDDRFADGGEVARSWDQRNALLLGAAWRYRPLLLSATAGYVSGWPYTALSFEGPPSEDVGGFSTAVLGPRNRQRFEDRFLLDLRAQYSLRLPRGKLEFLLEVRNAASQGNDCCRDLELEALPGGGFAGDLRQRKWLGMLPILGVNWRF